MNRISRVAVALSLGLAVAGSNAATITLTGTVFGAVAPGISSPIASSNVDYGAVLAASNLSGAPGYSLLTNSNVTGFFTFCVELTQAFVTGPNSGYSIVDPASGAYSPGLTNGWGTSAAQSVLISQRIDQVLSNGLSVATSASDFGALQLALWETIYDFGSAFDLSSTGGNFQASGISGTILTTAASYYATTAAATAHYYVAKDVSHQDVLVVPEPATLALAATALAGLALSRRRSTPA